MDRNKGRSKQIPDKSHRVTTSGDIEVSTYLGIAKEIAGEQPVTAKEAIPGAEREAIIVIDFGSQYSMLIARRVREAGVYSEIHPYTIPMSELRAAGASALILSGGPASVDDPDAPKLEMQILDIGLPVLGICYGLQLLAHFLGGQVAPAHEREYGRAEMEITTSSLYGKA